MGRFGRTVLLPVTLIQFPWFATPVPRLNPICTLPSLVPTIATLWNFGEYLTWFIKERPASVPFVRQGLEPPEHDVLLVLYHADVGTLAFVPLMVSQTRV